MPIIDPTVALSSRQEAFCRHYTASTGCRGPAPSMRPGSRTGPETRSSHPAMTKHDIP